MGAWLRVLLTAACVAGLVGQGQGHTFACTSAAQGTQEGTAHDLEFKTIEEPEHHRFSVVFPDQQEPKACIANDNPNGIAAQVCSPDGSLKAWFDASGEDLVLRVEYTGQRDNITTKVVVFC